MNLIRRYNQLSIWNKVAFWGSTASIIGLILVVFVKTYTHSSTQQIISSPGSMQAGRDIVIRSQPPYEEIEPNEIKCIELSDLVAFFMVKSDYDWDALEFSHGTAGQIPVSWQIKGDQDPHDKTVCRTGRVYVSINEQAELTINPDGTLEPWIIRLLGRWRAFKWGYIEIELTINCIHDISQYIITNMPKKGFKVDSKDCTSPLEGPPGSIVMHHLNKRGYQKATIVQSVSSGTCGDSYYIYIYPFEDLECRQLIQETYVDGPEWPGRMERVERVEW